MEQFQIPTDQKPSSDSPWWGKSKASARVLDAEVLKTRKGKQKKAK